MSELANTRVFGSAEPNVLGIEDFDEDYLFVLQCLCEGLTIEQMKSAFQEELSEEDLRGLGNKPEMLYDTIQNSTLFCSIFLDMPSAVAAPDNSR